MKYFYTLLLALSLITPAFSQNYCDQASYFTVPAGLTGINDYTVVVDSAVDFYGVNFPIKLRFAEPTGDSLPFTKRPLVIGVHGGGFFSDSLSGSATGAYGSMYTQVRDVFAQFGYITASLDYRCGYGVAREQALLNSLFAIGKDSTCAELDPGLMAAFDTAAYRASADLRSALHYIFTHPDSFPTVDTSKIFLYGASAGAITILHAAFSEKDDLFQGSSLPQFAPKHRLAGIAPESGAFVNAFGKAVQQITLSDSVPLFLAQGTADPVVPAEYGPLNNCSNIHPKEWWTGSVAIAGRACELKYKYNLVLIKNAGHDIHANTSGLVEYQAMVGFFKNTGLCGKNPDFNEAVIDTSGAVLSGKFCTPPRTNYCDVPYNFLYNTGAAYIDTFQVNVDTLKNYYGVDFPVKLKMARPVYDTLGFVKRPLIINVHGGGFVSDSLGDKLSTNAYLDQFNAMRQYLAPIGYNVASLDYRTGYGKINEYILASALGDPAGPPCANLTADVLKYMDTAVYRAVFDCRQAIDYICKNSELFPYIDTSAIFLYGHSAGAITILHAAFSEAGDIFHSTNPGLPPFPPKHKLAGIVALAGALTPNFATALQDITFAESVPVFLGHGTLDSIVPVDSGAVGTCPNVSAADCFNGSVRIAERLCDQKIPYELFLIEGGGHDLAGGTAGNNAMNNDWLTFIPRRGLCHDTAASTEKIVKLDGTIVSQTKCLDHTGITEVKSLKPGLYPNPVSNELNIDALGARIENTEIMDVSGRTVMKTTGNQTTINTSGLVSGVYFIRIATDKGLFTNSFVKH